MNREMDLHEEMMNDTLLTIIPFFFFQVQLVQNFPFLQMFDLDPNVPFPSQTIYFLLQSLFPKVQLRQSSVEMGVRQTEFFHISVLTGA